MRFSRDHGNGNPLHTCICIYITLQKREATWQFSCRGKFKDPERGLCELHHFPKIDQDCILQDRDLLGGIGWQCHQNWIATFYRGVKNDVFARVLFPCKLSSYNQIDGRTWSNKDIYWSFFIAKLCGDTSTWHHKVLMVFYCFCFRSVDIMCRRQRSFHRIC